jgi:hypothetical protein
MRNRSLPMLLILFFLTVLASLTLLESRRSISSVSASAAAAADPRLENAYRCLPLTPNRNAANSLFAATGGSQVGFLGS